MKKTTIGVVLCVYALLVVLISIAPAPVYAGNDDGENPPEVGVEWINDYPGTENDRYYMDDSAGGLYNKLGNTGWDKRFNYGDSSAWEEDFKDVSNGGTDNIYIDDVDIAMFAGHSTVKDGHVALYFTTLHDDYYLEWFDPEWGDRDLEWIGLHSCQVLRDADLSYWACTLNGLHLLCGFKSYAYDTSTPMGKKWADRMIDDGWWDVAYTVKQSWWYAADVSQPSGTVVRVMGETLECGDDYIWGQGTVCSDPPVDGTKYYWTHTV
ncbi:hypothetical protein C5S30_03985 [ANME-1 cluster archaeon GoMg4]|nr:hypothetical protein [ANME-1 cluster archaeon GoMg4]